MTDVKLVGNDDNGGTTNWVKDFLIFQRFQAVKSGNLTSIQVHVGSTATNAMVALYANVSGPNPGALLTSCASTPVAANGLRSLTVPGHDIVKDTYYWLAVINGPDFGRIQYKAGTGLVCRHKAVTFAGFAFPATYADAGFTHSTIYDMNFAGWGAEALASSWAGTWGG